MTFSRVNSVLIAGVLALGTVVATNPPAEAVTPTCNHAAKVTYSQSSYRYIPAYGFSPTTYVCLMRPGYNGVAGEVGFLQEALNRCNNISPLLVVDDKYGTKTTAAVETVQQRAGLSVDSLYGPNTRDAMRWPVFTTTGGVRTFLRCAAY